MNIDIYIQYYFYVNNKIANDYYYNKKVLKITIVARLPYIIKKEKRM